MARQPRTIRYGGAMLDQKEIDAVVNVMKTGMSIGEKVVNFENMVAPLLGKRYGIMVNSGSSALLMAMRLIDLPKGSEVITPTLTFGTDISSIVCAGYVPAFVDVELDTYQIDIDKIEAMITPKTRAMLVPNLVGGMPDWDRLRAIADKHKLILIEDSCDTLGGSFRGRPAGERADISVTSFSIFHIITALGNGGMVCVDDEKLWDRGLSMRCWGRSSEKYLYGTKREKSDGRFLEDLDGIEYDGMFIFEDIAYGFIPNEAGAAFGIEQVKKLDHFSELRTTLFDRHTAFLKRHEDVFILPRLLDETVTTWICYPIQLRDELGWSRRSLQVHLEENGVFTRVIFTGNAMRQPMMKGVECRAAPEGYPMADLVMENGLMLPCHPTMTEEDCDYLYDVLEEWIAKQRKG
ncbi:MAG TPA: aminotransferase class I/II-fold pyridoxal phosphate-dependent enzyme [Spongiibacteraceae bacterium]|jgi:CDP-6-deoxy-D-xylo-4-hexulose-3-dehydrase|nr:aminotransferase class I/II-fold pyridoxal phosphate-dependent enzyme [Spongiibacteraceae bacterium]HUH38901.1 aminotransferase class I/II-fold pyridoxal phosphate-dependent enzyme [Spongiibacteraceae bacterium]